MFNGLLIIGVGLILASYVLKNVRLRHMQAVRDLNGLDRLNRIRTALLGAGTVLIAIAAYGLLKQ